MREKDLFCLVSWMINYGMECRARFLQEAERDEDDKDGDIDKQ